MLHTFIIFSGEIRLHVWGTMAVRKVSSLVMGFLQILHFNLFISAKVEWDMRNFLPEESHTSILRKKEKKRYFYYMTRTPC